VKGLGKGYRRVSSCNYLSILRDLDKQLQQIHLTGGHYAYASKMQTALQKTCPRKGYQAGLSASSFVSTPSFIFFVRTV
jgi:DNA gyrase inhibitor GyrI